MEDKEKLKNLIEGLAEFVSKDTDTAKEYLKQELDKHESLIEENNDFLRKIISKHKLEVGRKKRLSFESLKEKFKEKILGLSINEIFEIYPTVPKLAFSNLEQEKITEKEIENLMEKASFLNFLEEHFENDSE